ncbi:hypothetical protein [Aurantiacibacter rhizosphaerae]|uniref:Uncharacterized protein n=1 Tax=Aurantiacibacter rhizosphaerae TaxID=2691582 RepID=A0A844XES5_9SPHN|nr:hypothetical protein [Aurantiacibacter rhizosphaerae]MWV28253.1 hypothetical protein [Aurantiacibacter rhizosphaerae]
MSTYAKAWVFNGVWTLFALCGLAGLYFRWVGGKDDDLLLLIGIAGYLACFFLAGSFPKCPNCDEPVNDAHIAGDSRNGHVVRPDRPPRTCGYCGQDLT